MKIRPQKLLIISPKLFFHSTDTAAQTSPELICLLICGCHPNPRMAFYVLKSALC